MTNPSLPIIGISGARRLTPSMRAMASLVRQCGATPRILNSHDEDRDTTDLKNVHALVLMGNDLDIAPEQYVSRYPRGDPRARIHSHTRSERCTAAGTARACYEEGALAHALASGTPLLGICGGMQRINVACGGTLHQHVPDLVGSNRHAQHEQGIKPHLPVVPILIIAGTLLADIARVVPMPFLSTRTSDTPTVLSENSMHHQAIDLVAPGLRACALSDAFPRPDGTRGYMVEAIEAEPNGPFGQQFLLGVQWHPEFSASSLGVPIVERVVNEATRFAARSRQAPAS